MILSTDVPQKSNCEPLKSSMVKRLIAIEHKTVSKVFSFNFQNISLGQTNIKKYNCYSLISPINSF